MQMQFDVIEFTQKCHEPLLESLKVRFDASDFITVAKA
jgi:hypothetical protein